MIGEKLALPVDDAIDWLTDLINSRFGPVTVLHVRAALAESLADLRAARALVSPLDSALRAADSWESTNLVHQLEGLMRKVLIAQLPYYREQYAHAFSRLHLNILRQIAQAAERSCGQMARLKTYLGISPTAQGQYFYLPTWLHALQGIHNLEITSPVGEVYADPSAITRILAELCRNSYEAGATHLHLGVQREGPYVWLRLQDDGRGMSEAERARAFEPFFQGRPDAERLGLGLSIARRLAKQQHCSLILSPLTPSALTPSALTLKGTGRGTEAALALPLARS